MHFTNFQNTPVEGKTNYFVEQCTQSYKDNDKCQTIIVEEFSDLTEKRIQNSSDEELTQ